MAICKRFCNQIKSNQRRTGITREKDSEFTKCWVGGLRDLVVWDPSQVEKQYSYSNWERHAIYNHTTVSTNLWNTLIASPATKIETYSCWGLQATRKKQAFSFLSYQPVSQNLTNRSHKMFSMAMPSSQWILSITINYFGDFFIITMYQTDIRSITYCNFYQWHSIYFWP